MKQPPSDSEAKNSPMAPSSSAFYYRQTATKSVTGYHQMPPESHEIVIEMEPYTVRIGADNQLHSGSGFSTVDCSTLSKLVKEKRLDDLANLGGVEGIGTSLKTDAECGIVGDIEEISRRTKAFGSNSYVKPPTKSFFCFVWEAVKDPTILILLVCAALSLGFGIKENGPKDGWYDGGSIFVAVFLVVSLSAISNFRQYKKFNELANISNNISVEVVRNGRRQEISIFEVVVADIICLKIGDQVPADGLFVEGHSLQVDESSMTGESHHVEVTKDQNPFLFSGTKVADGYGKMLVTSVGMNTTWGEMMSTISYNSDEQTPLQARSNQLTSSIGKVGLAVAFLVLVVLLVRYFTGNTLDENGNKEFNGSKTEVDDVINAVVGIITAAVTIVVVAIPEGLPLAVRLTLAYSMKRMMADQALVRNLSACEATGSATTICTDITRNRMNVTKSFIGKESMEGRSYTSIATNVLQLLVQGISLTRGSAHKLFKVTPMDDAIHVWAVMKLNMEMDKITEGLSILNVEASCPEKKRMGILVKRQSDNMIHVHWRGDFERILSLCSHYYDITGNTIPLDDQERGRFRQTIEDMGASGLRYIAFAHRHLSEEDYENERADKEIPDKNLILLGVVGLKGFCRPGTKEAIEICQIAGVNVKMITGENVSAAKAIAMECGILSPLQEENDGSTVTGEEFRRYKEKERMERVEQISIMARSSPFDKLLMVQCLKEKGHVVAVTGDGTNDAPALKEADIGLAMGICGTDVEKEISDIIILDDNFASVASVLKWGRCVYNNIQKFIQFQLTVNVAALVVNFVAAVSTGKTPLTAAQLLWVNLIMDTLGALALATEKPSMELMKRPPVGRHDPLITNIMWRNILGQALYQIAVILALKFKGNSIFRVQENVIGTLIFTTFVLLQVFNLFNAKELEEKNVFKGILKNKLFLGIAGITIILQVIMVELLNKFAHTERLDWKQWGVSIGIAAFSLPTGWLVKFIPVPKKQMLTYPII
ncbi:hypothetical protein Pfo_026308 [Paulownia fortunei]|nr:hypothetical protein Pfo_026308 [Paulownia fortunei]